MYNYYLLSMSALYMYVKYLSLTNNITFKNISSFTCDICFAEQVYSTNPIALSDGQLDNRKTGPSSKLLLSAKLTQCFQKK